ncbi:ABC transporter permease [Enemella evansiae]|uniref:amino acid ABC transporter permease n=1 Tax=Enemella evansiae TaxID=2016499 RepID=UPI000B9601C6|nr:amino acid ABC transporter permease [Enemella evansiae]OYO19056.1 ABC transporter permease [Enemella evansiae]
MSTVESATRSATPEEELQIVPRRSTGTIIGAVVVALLGAWLLWILATNPRFEWGVVRHYFTHKAIARGALLTLELTVISMVLGVLLGVVLAVMRMTRNRLVSGAAGLYIWFFRGTPLLIQLIFWFNLAALFPVITIGIPFGPTFYSGSANAFITPLSAALLGLTLNEAAYMAEIVRGGLLGVDRGQTEAAQALGLGRGRILGRIVLPQAMRVIIPPTGNQAISMLKNTSLVSVLGVGDLLHSAQIVYSRTYQTIPLLIVASLWYLVFTTVLGIGQHYIERHFGRGSTTLVARTRKRRNRSVEGKAR